MLIPSNTNKCHNQKNLLFQFVNNSSVRDGLGIKHQRFLGSWLKCVLKNKVPKSDSDCLIRFFVLFTYHLITCWWPCYHLLNSMKHSVQLADGNVVSFAGFWQNPQNYLMVFTIHPEGNIFIKLHENPSSICLHILNKTTNVHHRNDFVFTVILFTVWASFRTSAVRKGPKDLLKAVWHWRETDITTNLKVKEVWLHKCNYCSNKATWLYYVHVYRQVIRRLFTCSDQFVMCSGETQNCNPSPEHTWYWSSSFFTFLNLTK